MRKVETKPINVNDYCEVPPDNSKPTCSGKQVSVHFKSCLLMCCNNVNDEYGVTEHTKFRSLLPVIDAIQKILYTSVKKDGIHYIAAPVLCNKFSSNQLCYYNIA
jgi:hypothetical protein